MTRPWRGLAVAAVLLAACSAPPPSATGGRLLVTTARDGVVLLDPATGDAEVLLADDERSGPLQPTSSPDGSRVAWSTGGAAAAVWSEGGVEEFETPFVPFYFAWSPDSRLLALLGNDPAGAGVAGVVLDPADGRVSTLDAAASFFLAWHPDGDRMAVHLGAERLSLLEAGGGQLPLDLPAGPYQAPDWLDDGRLVAITPSNGASALVAVRPGRDPEETLADVSGAAVFAVSPAGGRIALLEGSPQAGVTVGRLTVVPAGGGEAIVVSERPVAAFQWSPSGDLLLFLWVDVENRQFVPEVWDGEERRAYPGFAPTAALLAEYLPFWGQYLRSLSLWATDGSAFAYPAAGPEGGRILVQRLTEEAPEEVGSGEFVAWTR